MLESNLELMTQLLTNVSFQLLNNCARISKDHEYNGQRGILFLLKRKLSKRVFVIAKSIIKLTSVIKEKPFFALAPQKDKAS